MDCPTCGNPIPESKSVCPFCGNRVTGRPSKKKRSRPDVFVIDLERGLPTVEQAQVRMRQEVARARQTGAGAVKLIHGYGSSGTGGRIRPAIRKTLAQMQRRREINDFLYGEDFHRGCENGRRVLGRMPYLDRDSDYNRNNPGITIVLL